MLNRFETVSVGGVLTADTVDATHNIATEISNGATNITISPTPGVTQNEILTLSDGSTADWELSTFLGFGDGTSGLKIDVTDEGVSENSFLSVVDSERAEWVDKITDDGQNFFLGSTIPSGPIPGPNNVVMGLECLHSNDGTNNVMFGLQCVYSGSSVCDSVTAAGDEALTFVVDARRITAIGSNASHGISFPRDCTMLGTYAAGLNLTDGLIPESMFLGAYSDSNQVSYQNSTAIGYQAIVGDSNAIKLGNEVNVGINVGDPQATLHISPFGNKATLQLDSSAIPSSPQPGSVILFNANGLWAKNQDGTDVLFIPETSQNPGASYSLPYLSSAANKNSFGYIQIGSTGTAGQAKVQTSYVVPTSKILLSRQTLGTTPGYLSILLIEEGSFTIVSTESADNGVVNWFILTGNF